MDLLGAQEPLAYAPEQQAWEVDEGAFHTHFGVPFEEYAGVVSMLTQEQLKLLRATLAVNPEAAVLWVLAMQET